MTARDDRFLLKLATFLHDPPDKCLNIKGHERRAEALRTILCGEASPPAGMEKADWAASATERLTFEKGGEKIIQEYTGMLHSLSGEPVGLSTLTLEEAEHRTREAAEALSAEADARHLDAFGRYLLFWNELPSRLGKDFETLTAETRLPDHSLQDHLDAAAAFAGLELSGPNRPAFLFFSLGPVQPFIAASRRVEDLWAASLTLSHLAFEAMCPVLEAAGPDAVLFPRLRGQPLFEAWLERRSVLTPGQVPASARHLPSLPNKFVALVSLAEAKDLAAACTQACRSAFSNLGEAIKRQVRPLGDLVSFNEQLSAHLELQATVRPWPDGGGKEPLRKLIERHGALFGQEAAQPWHTLQRYLQSTKYPLDQSTQLFSLLLREGLALAEAAKQARRFDPWPGDSREKCSLCGAREAMGPQKNFKEFRAHWEQAAHSLKHTHRLKKGEALCAVCLCKRFSRDHLAKACDFDASAGAFPSTAVAATASWRHELLQLLDHAEVTEAAQAFCDALKTAVGEDWRRQIALATAPGLEDEADDDPLARDLCHIEGDWFYKNTYQRQQSLEEEYPNTHFGPVQSALAALKKAAGRAKAAERNKDQYQSEQPEWFPEPPSYYAILALDGDEVGTWVSGTHRARPTYQELLPEKTLQEFKKFGPDAKSLLATKRLPGPSYYAALSRQLGVFGLQEVPDILRQYLGILIYSGGDDVLALLPVNQAIDCALDLRKAYRSTRCLGHKATVSVGLAIGHVHGTPLGQLLEEARTAESRAKKDYGRDALCLRVRKRSGESLEFGCGFDDPLLDIVQRYRELYDDDQVSGKLAYDLHAVLDPLLEGGEATRLPAELLLSEIRRQWPRHWLAKTSGWRDQADQVLQALKLATVLAEQNGKHPAARCKSLLDGMLAAQFLSRKGVVR